MRPAYPTAAELQRMSFHAKDRLRRRLAAERNPRPATEDAEPRRQGSGAKDPKELSQKWVLTCHRRFIAGDITDAVRIGETEYQRRVKERLLRHDGERGQRAAWDLARAVRMRKGGARWVDIARAVGATDDAVSKAVTKALARERQARDGATGEAA